MAQAKTTKGGGKTFLSVGLSKDWAKLLRWLKEATKGKRNRSTAWSRLMSRNAADFILHEVKRRIPPKTDELRAYRDSLVALDMRPTRVGKTIAYPTVVVSNPKEKVLEDAEEGKDTTVLWVRPSRAGRPDAAVSVLVRFSPWTRDTLPWWPPRGRASVVAAKVREDEWKNVHADRERDLPRAIKMLLDAGVRARRPAATEYAGRTVLDGLALMAIRMEYGLPGAPIAAPHWRPAVRALRTRGLKLIMAGRGGAYKEAKRAMIDPDYSGWKAVRKRRMVDDPASLRRDTRAFAKALRLAQIT